MQNNIQLIINPIEKKGTVSYIYIPILEKF